MTFCTPKEAIKSQNTGTNNSKFTSATISYSCAKLANRRLVEGRSPNINYSRSVPFSTTAHMTHDWNLGATIDGGAGCTRASYADIVRASNGSGHVPRSSNISHTLPNIHNYPFDNNYLNLSLSHQPKTDRIRLPTWSYSAEEDGEGIVTGRLSYSSQASIFQKRIVSYCWSP